LEKINFSIEINAPKEKVWDTMLKEDTYQIWTEAFAKGSYYKGDWNEGSKILFLAPGEKGEGGMVSRIKENRPYEYISIEHIGMIQNGNEDTTSDEVKKWAGALENYTFKETDGTTELSVEMDSADEYKEMFQTMWPNALNKLKELAEK
jgi:uncharacterized protein YndB with AHSA1/START domain